MKKIKLQFLLLVLLGIGSAWINRPPKTSKFTLHKYSYLSKSFDGTRYYYQYDITAAGWVEGIDYDCTLSSNTCSITGDPGQSQFDAIGNYFLIWQIPSGGIDNSGVFTLD